MINALTNNTKTMHTQRQQIETLSAYECEYLDWYVRAHDTVGEPFDPRVCVQLARAQWSSRPELATAFARCTAQWPRREEGLYTHFIAPIHMAERWHFYGSLFLKHPEWGTLVVDVISDPEAPEGLSIGGIEFLDRVMRQPREEKRELYWPAGDAVPTSQAPQQGRMRVVHVASTVVGRKKKPGEGMSNMEC